MARIRTIKPEFFRHEKLFEAEQASGLPLRVAFAGLWTAADRSGRFKWRPRQLKLDVLPFDDVEFEAVLQALEAAGFIRQYMVEGEPYGWIPTWSRHQVINNREVDSVLPPPPGLDGLSAQAEHPATKLEARVADASGTREARVADASGTREARVADASGTPLVHAQGEGEGELEGERSEGRRAAAVAIAPPQRNCGTRLPCDWELPKSWGEAAVEEGWPEQVVRLEARKFRNHWVAKTGRDATKMDWHATWENWLLKVPKDARPSHRGPLRVVGRQTAIEEANKLAGAAWLAQQEATDASH